MQSKSYTVFKAIIHIIGINPFVFVPDKILKAIFTAAGREKGPIPIRGNINGKPYKQTLVKYSNEWRLYINTTMLKDSPKRIGEKIDVSVMFDNESRNIEMPAAFSRALKENKEAASAFEKLTPSRKKEIVQYLANLKTTESLERNIIKAIAHLAGKEKFVGREKNKPVSEKKPLQQAWHVLQQKQGKVKPNSVVLSQTAINDNDALEREANIMGEKASAQPKYKK